MPVPKPSPDESEADFMGRCMSKMADEDPDMDNTQRLAMCFDAFRSGKKKGESINKTLDEKGRIIVAENVKLIFNGTIDFKE